MRLELRNIERREPDLALQGPLRHLPQGDLKRP